MKQITLTTAEKQAKYNFLVHTLPENESRSLDLNSPLGKFLLESDYFTSPASTKYHGNYEGGLFDHSYNVAIILKQFSDKLKLNWENPRSAILVGLLHDVCKIGCYEKIPEGYIHNNKSMYSGHGYKSIAVLSPFIQLTREEVACIVHHMGAYEKDAWKEYDLAIHEFPNVLFTHTADMVASKCLEE